MSGRNQFWYKRVIKVSEKEKEEGKQDKIVYDCLNLDFVIRGIWTKEDVFTLLLADGHEDATIEQVPKIQKGKVVSIEQKRGPKEYLQSQINLDIEDAEKYRRMTDVSYWDNHVPKAPELDDKTIN